MITIRLQSPHRNNGINFFIVNFPRFSDWSNKRLHNARQIFLLCLNIDIQSTCRSYNSDEYCTKEIKMAKEKLNKNKQTQTPHVSGLMIPLIVALTWRLVGSLNITMNS